MVRLDWQVVLAMFPAYLALYFAGVLALRPGGRSVPNLLLAGLLATLGLDALHTAVTQAGLYAKFPESLFILNVPAALTAPLILLYARSLGTPGFRLRPRHLLHGLPFLVLVVFVVVDFHALPRAQKLARVAADDFDSLVHRNIIPIFGTLQMVTYLVATQVQLARSRRRLGDTMSNLRHVDLAWLRFLVGGFLALWLVRPLLHVALNLEDTRVLDAVSGLQLILEFGFVNVAVARGLRQPEIFAEADPPADSGATAAPPRESFLGTLDDFMAREKPHLDANLTLARLARRFGQPSRRISEAINRSGANFCDYVNRYRLAEAERLLSDPTQGTRSIQDIMVASGFNSKSVFNAAFKRRTGLTPSGFRRRAGA